MLGRAGIKVSHVIEQFRCQLRRQGDAPTRVGLRWSVDKFTTDVRHRLGHLEVTGLRIDASNTERADLSRSQS